MAKRKAERPRDEKGRFVKKTTYIIIDDYGDTVPYTRREPVFGYAVTTTNNVQEMRDIARKNREFHNTVDEVKASNDTLFHKIRMSVEIRRAELDTNAYYVDKRRPPNGWDVEKREGESKREYHERKNEVRNDVLYKVIQESVKGLDGDVEVIVDYHTGNKHIRDRSRKLSNKTRQIHGDQYKSERTDGQDELYSDVLQVNDYVTNAAGSAVKGFPMRLLCIGTRMRRFKKWDRISEKP